MNRFLWILAIILVVIILQPGIEPNILPKSSSKIRVTNVATLIPLTKEETKKLNIGYEQTSSATTLEVDGKRKMGSIECSFSTECRNRKNALKRSPEIDNDDNLVQTLSPDGYYLRPVPGVLTQGPHGRNRNGLDMRAAIGTPVRAAAEGRVLEVSRHRTSGRFVRIKHSNGTKSFYGHLSKQLVRVGDVVTRGQVIALSGNTGRTTGPHLHFAMEGTRNPFSR